MRSTTPIHLPISMVRELPEFFSSPPRSIAQPQIRFITLDGLQPPYPPRSPSFASLLWADGASRMHVFVDPRPRYVGNTRVPWGRGKILPLSVPRLFRPLSSAMHCLQTSTRFVSLGYCSGEKMKFLPSGLFWWDFLWNGAGSLAFRGFPSSKLFFRLPRSLRSEDSRFCGLWVYDMMHSSFITRRNLVFGLEYVIIVCRDFISQFFVLFEFLRVIFICVYIYIYA